MWNLKGCPRCGGDLYREEEGGIYYKVCLQDGYRIEIGREPTEIKCNQSLDKLVLPINSDIGLLEVLEGKKRPITLDTLHPVIDLPIKEINESLQRMAGYGYVSRIQNGVQPDKYKFQITPKGRSVVEDYQKVSKLSGDNVLYDEIAGKDGELTAFGKYAIKASKNLSSFVEEIYRKTSKSSEVKEAPEKVLVGTPNS